MTTREPNGPATPQDPTESWASPPTSELPVSPAAQPAQPADQAAHPATQTAGQPAPEHAAHPAYATAGAGGPSGLPPQSAPAPSAPGGPAGPPPYAAGPGGPRPSFWRRATSTTGGLVALVVAAVLVVLLLVGAAGAAAFAVGRGLNHHGEARVGQVHPGRGNGMGPGMRGPGERGLGEQHQLGPQQRGNGMGGNGGGSLLGGAGALGAVEHGEFTVTGSGGTPTTMTLQRGTVTAASATSLSVRSTDGFTATYALDSSTRTPARTVANGDSVLVVAQKQGSKAVLVRLTR